MTTLPLSFLLLILSTALPEAVEASRLLNRGEPVPDDLKNHPNFKDACRVRLSQEAYTTLVDMVLITDDESVVNEVFDFFGLNGDNRASAATARLAGKTTTEELTEVRESVHQIEAMRRTLPEALHPMLIGPPESYQPIIDRYNAIGLAINTLSSLLVGKGIPADEPADEADESGAEEGGLPEGFSTPELQAALSEAISSGGAVAVEIGPDGVKVIKTGSVEEAMQAADEATAASTTEPVSTEEVSP